MFTMCVDIQGEGRQLTRVRLHRQPWNSTVAGVHQKGVASCLLQVLDRIDQRLT